MKLKSILRKITVVTAITALSVTALGLLFHAAGGRVNTTRSIPVGLYWASGKPVEKGAYVLLCPPRMVMIAEAKRRGYLATGFCPGKVGYMMKRISAAKDDLVAITDAGVTVNGALLPHSAPMATDKSGRPMPRYQHAKFTVSDNEVLVMSDVSAKSFDGRYFGPVLRSQIQTVIVPVITW
ncbi:conjugative transfer signal peptidase TraF [Massilia glaciei]|uniref:Conjugative transfer signal peptidase TraF n=1 Tax=Massilia glaciei TaxID=1524097 RepID=A0A2U2I5R7_9BURK|nr:conjugative transfer signal peptidase TraF [Massilia glaciei]PWF54985.1 conjugative transfer signal peptidase TraF [Massilia glaciei]